MLNCSVTPSADDVARHRYCSTVRQFIDDANAYDPISSRILGNACAQSSPRTQHTAVMFVGWGARIRSMNAHAGVLPICTDICRYARLLGPYVSADGDARQEVCMRKKAR